MARNETDREDFMAEAKSLVHRLELSVPTFRDHVFGGFRTNGWLSVYFGPDCHYQFDDQGRLRRAFVDGLLYRTEGSSLTELLRVRSQTETTLVSRTLLELELIDFQIQVIDSLTRLRTSIVENNVSVIRQVPEDNPALLNELRLGLDRVIESPVFLAASIVRRK